MAELVGSRIERRLSAVELGHRREQIREGTLGDGIEHSLPREAVEPVTDVVAAAPPARVGLEEQAGGVNGDLGTVGL